MIIITGANGFVGQHLVPMLIKRFPQEKIICCVGPSRKKHEIDGLTKLQKLPVKILPVNILQKSSLKKLPKSPDILVHLAAAVDTSKSDFGANDVGTKNLLEALNGLNKKTQVVYTSTGAVWAGRKSYQSLNESIPPEANNEYGRTKLKGEELFINRTKKIGSGLTILRLNTVYGNDPREDKLFGMMSKLVKKDSFIARLNWPGRFGVVHVDDVARSIVECIKRPSESGQTRKFIVSTENVTLPFISKLMYKELKLKYQPLNLPNWIWDLFALGRYVTFTSEKILPAVLYNLVWRTVLITNDVFKADGSKLMKILPKWKRKRLKDKIKEAII